MQTKNGRFEVGPRLRAGRADVYSGRSRELGYPVAIKVPTGADAPAAFSRESAALRVCRHPHIARLLDVTAMPDGQACMVLDWIDGVTLHQWMQSHRRANPAQGAWVARQVLAALDFLHGAGMVLGDLQPSNVMITPAGSAEHVTVFDLGAAYGTGGPDPEKPMAAPRYAAPEIREGRHPTERSDIYSVGAILYELISGHAATESVRSDDAPVDAIVPVPSGLARLIHRCLAIDPAARFPRVGELIIALESLDPATLIREGVASGGHRTLSSSSEPRTLELPDEADHDRVTLPRTEAPVDARKLATLRSTGDPLIWIFTGDPALESLGTGETDSEFGPDVDVARLDEGHRKDQLGLLTTESIHPPWLVIFGASQADDELLAWLGCRSVETARVLVAGNDADSVTRAVNGPGVDRVADPSTVVDTVRHLFECVRERRRVRDHTRLLLDDSLADTAALQAKLGGRLTDQIDGALDG